MLNSTELVNSRKLGLVPNREHQIILFFKTGTTASARSQESSPTFNTSNDPLESWNIASLPSSNNNKTQIRNAKSTVPALVARLNNKVVNGTGSWTKIQTPADGVNDHKSKPQFGRI